MSLTEVNENSLKFRLPCGIIIGGPSGSGKTTFVKRLLSQSAQMFAPAPKAILYCYSEYNSDVAELERLGVQTTPEPPDDTFLQSMPKPFLLVLDDMMLTIDENRLNALFTKKAHHGNFGVIFLSQSMFERKLSVMRQNSQYLTLMRAPIWADKIRTLGHQLFPKRGSQFMECYADSTSGPFSYLLIDMHPSTDNQLRLRANIFPDETTTTFGL